jgi:hypothetical protein
MRPETRKIGGYFPIPIKTKVKVDALKRLDMASSWKNTRPITIKNVLFENNK